MQHRVILAPANADPNCKNVNINLVFHLCMLWRPGGGSWTGGNNKGTHAKGRVIDCCPKVLGSYPSYTVIDKICLFASWRRHQLGVIPIIINQLLSDRRY